ncbi:MerR family DNA-binding transcriptional regulator [Selenomonas sp. KH1T6]|uniref:MerR family DNA-binding transcriptional regulator n=1 Tax=Selenomonas sp. KH1T6 TaxID=3158784 RepID=UPI0008A80E94|nr:MerR family regulatory protein [Selenomonas ruminantium]
MARRMTFHTGEFARITGVNKRTLHYYDQQGIFSPDSIEPNGYRAYSSRQFYPFYMIRMRDYLQEHKLKPAGPSYEESLLEDMSTANAEEFITRVAVPVDIS